MLSSPPFLPPLYLISLQASSRHLEQEGSLGMRRLVKPTAANQENLTGFTCPQSSGKSLVVQNPAYNISPPSPLPGLSPFLNAACFRHGLSGTSHRRTLSITSAEQLLKDSPPPGCLPELTHRKAITQASAALSEQKNAGGLSLAFA